jgi:hypothetical protein
MNETNIPTPSQSSDALESHVAEDLVVPPETWTTCAGNAVWCLLGLIAFYFIKLCEWINDSRVIRGILITHGQNYPHFGQLPQYQPQLLNIRQSSGVESRLQEPVQNLSNSKSKRLFGKTSSFQLVSPDYFQKKTGPSQGSLPTTFSPEERLCKICYEKDSNTIVNACGHGGMCNTCAINYLELKSDCMICRKKIDKIFVINIIDGTKIEMIEEFEPTHP